MFIIKIAIMEKMEALEKLISKLGISERMLMNWFYERSQNNKNRDNLSFKKATNLIPTRLPLVYYHNNKLVVKYWLDLSYKKELLGIQLLPGVILFLRRRWNEDDCSPNGLSWGAARDLAKGLRFNGKRGRLPSLSFLKKKFSDREMDKFIATRKVLAENNIEVDDGYYFWKFWCSEEDGLYAAYFFDLFEDRIDSSAPKGTPYCCEYLAVDFR